MSRNGAIAIPIPTYGYLGGSLLLHEKLDYDLHNERVEKDLEDMTYVDEFGSNDSAVAFICQEGGCACRFHMMYTKGVVGKGDIWEKLAELQID